MHRTVLDLLAALRTAARTPLGSPVFLALLIAIGTLIRPMARSFTELPFGLFLVAGLSQALGAVVLVLHDRLVAGRADRTGLGLYLLTVIASGAISALTYENLQRSWEPGGPSFAHVGVGVVNASALVLVLHVSYAVVVGFGREYHSTTMRLRDVRQELRALRGGGNAMLQSEHAALAERTHEVLGEALRDIQATVLQSGDVETRALVDDLRGTIDDGLRPLTRAMLALDEPVLPEGVAPARQRLMAFAPFLRLREVFRPEFLIIVPLPIYLSTVYAIYGLLGIAPGLLAAALEYSLMRLVVAWAPQEPMPRVSALLWVAVTPVIVAAAGTVPIYLVTHASVDPGRTWPEVYFTELGLAPFFNLALAYAFSVLGNLRQARGVLARAEGELRAERVRQSQRLWAARRQWAYHIHGTVQSQLTAALLMLQLQPIDWERVRDNVQQAVRCLSTLPPMHLRISELLSSLQQTWEGICRIECHVTPLASRRIEADWQTLFALNEVLKEAVSNAIRHSASTTLDITLTIDGDTLQVVAAGEQHKVPHGTVPGLGKDLYDQVATEWSLEGNVLTLSLPLP